MKKFALVSIIVFAISLIHGLDMITRNGIVTDAGNMLSFSAESVIENEIRRLSQERNIDFAVLILPALDGENIDLFTAQTMQQWFPPDKRKNALLLVIAIKERQLKIEMGSHLVPDMADWQIRGILREFVKPQFQMEQYAAGILSGSQMLLHVLNKNVTLREKGFD